MRPLVLLGLLTVPAVWLTADMPGALAAPVPKAPLKTTAEKLYGRWKIVKTPTGPQPEGKSAIVEFRKDGTHTLTVESPDGNYSLSGKWSADGDKIPYTMQTGAGGDRSETLTIKKLTADLLITIDPDDQVEEFKRIKD